MVFKRYLTVLSLVLCLFFLAAGVIVARNNTERSLQAVENETVDETEIINAVKEKIDKFNMYFK